LGLCGCEKSIRTSRWLSSADDRRKTILSVVDHGAAGFIPKTAQPGVMGAALSLIVAGGVYLPACVLEEAAAHGSRKPELDSNLPLPVAPANQVRTRCQLEDRESAWLCPSAVTARACGQGDRVAVRRSNIVSVSNGSSRRRSHPCPRHGRIHCLPGRTLNAPR
jgi:hypothetical protein